VGTPATALTLHELLSDRAQSNGEAAAILAPGRHPMTYAALLTHVETIVGVLRTTGVRRNDRVIVVLPSGPEAAAAFLAVAACATCAPLNPSYRKSEFNLYIGDLAARALVVWSEWDSPSREVARNRGIPIIELTAAISEPAGTFRLSRTVESTLCPKDYARSDDTALVLHTSGTTSRPKIVPLTHANICSSGLHIRSTLAITQDDRCLNIMPLFHIHGLVGGLLSSLTAGGSVVCPPGLDPDRFFEWMDAFDPTWYTAVPTMHQAILAQTGNHCEIVAHNRLRFIRSCSAALPPKVLTDLEATFRTRVIDSYGMTEASHQMASNPLAPRPRKLGSVGIPAGPEIAIMGNSGELLPSGETGEVVIRGPNVTAGYENNAAANQRDFVNGWFRTGDQGRFDDEGYLYLTGRLKELINRGGEKIAPSEIDEVLLQHPAVSQAAAFAVTHPTLGEDVAAAIVVRADSNVTERDMIEFIAARLADFKVPRQIVIVDEIPKGPTGKIQRVGLATKLAGDLARARERTCAAPNTPMEQQLASLWKEILGVNRVGVCDSFYTLGGDSLAMATMMAEVQARFGIDIPIDAFLTEPTIQTVASLIQERPSEATSNQRTATRVEAAPIRDTFLTGVRNRVLQFLALYSPGYTTTRVALHRMRGVSIGQNVSIGLSAIIETAYPSLVSIGNDVTIGMRVLIIAHLRDSTAEARRLHRHTVRIEDKAYIGPGVIILPNVTIGQGAVVSAGSVVSRSVPPRTLVRGNPAVPVAQCGVSLGNGVSYEDFVRNLRPIVED